MFRRLMERISIPAFILLILLSLGAGRYAVSEPSPLWSQKIVSKCQALLNGLNTKVTDLDSYARDKVHAWLFARLGEEGYRKRLQEVYESQQAALLQEERIRGYRIWFLNNAGGASANRAIRRGDWLSALRTLGLKSPKDRSIKHVPLGQRITWIVDWRGLIDAIANDATLSDREQIDEIQHLIELLEMRNQWASGRSAYRSEWIGIPLIGRMHARWVGYHVAETQSLADAAVRGRALLLERYGYEVPPTPQLVREVFPETSREPQSDSTRPPALEVPGSDGDPL